MGFLKNSVSLLALVIGLIPPVWASDDLLTAKLIDEAHHWQEKNRPDLAANAWRKLLLVVPDYAEALSALRANGAQLPLGRGGDRAKPPEPAVKLPATEKDTRASVTSPAFQGSSSMMMAASKKQSAVAATVAASAPATLKQIPITQPAITARDRKTVPSNDEVLKQVRVVLPSTDSVRAAKPQMRPVTTFSGGSWAQKRQALEATAQDHPDSISDRLALARHLSTHEATRRESLRLMASVAQRGLIDQTSRQSWRAALIALTSQPGDAHFFTRYLGYYPADTAVRELAQSSAVSSANNLVIGPTTNTSTPMANELRISPSLMSESNSKSDTR